MGNMGELWRDIGPVLKKESKERKQRNFCNAILLLDKYKIRYEQKSDSHIVVEDKIDYWPSTGLFIDRKTKKRGRGVRQILKKVGK